MFKNSEINGYTVVGRVPEFAVSPTAFSPDDQLELLILRGEQGQRIVDGKTKVKDVVAEAAKTLGSPVKLVAFTRFLLGEGIEKEATDFAAEVAAAVGAA